MVVIWRELDLQDLLSVKLQPPLSGPRLSKRSKRTLAKAGSG